MEIDKHRWRQFQRKVFVNAPPNAIFTALTTAAGLRRWLLKEGAFFESDDAPLPDDDTPSAGFTFSFQWPHNEHVYAGRVSSLSRSQYVNFVFAEGHESVSFRIDRRPKKTLVTLTQQQDYPTEEENLHVYINSHALWTFYLTNLKSVLEGGSDLRARDPQGEADLVNL